MNYAYREINSDKTLNANDRIVGVNTSAGVVAVQLPPVNTVRSGFLLIIKDITGNAGDNNITVDADGTDQISGAGQISISTDYASVSLVAAHAATPDKGWDII